MHADPKLLHVGILVSFTRPVKGNRYTHSTHRIFCVLGHVALCVVYSFPAIKFHHVVNVNPQNANYLIYFAL
jgi:hypothetical protein